MLRHARDTHIVLDHRRNPVACNQDDLQNLQHPCGHASFLGCDNTSKVCSCDLLQCNLIKHAHLDKLYWRAAGPDSLCVKSSPMHCSFAQKADSSQPCMGYAWGLRQFTCS